MTATPSMRARIVILGACAAFAASASLACDDDGDEKAPILTPAATATRPPAPTPTPKPDPELAASLLAQGEFERAAEMYAALARDADGAGRVSSLFAQARVLLQLERYEEARPVLDDVLASLGDGADAHVARFMQGEVLLALGDQDGADEAFDRHAGAGGALADYARAEAAKLRTRAGLSAGAITAGEMVLASSLPQAYRARFALDLGTALERAGGDTAALEFYDRARLLQGDVASALARTGAIKRRLGDPSWTADYVTVVAGYPSSPVAVELVRELDEAGVPLSDYLRGVVYYRARNDADARASLERAAAAADHPAEATYYIAAIDERAGDTEAAIEGYARSYGIDPASPQADDALWWRGRLLEIAGRYGEASAVYEELLSALPGSSWAPDAAFHRGLSLYRAGDDEAAAFAWGVLAASSSEHERARALYWQARAERDAGLPQYIATLRAATAEFPADFYGLRATVLLGDAQMPAARVPLDRAIDWNAVSAYFVTTYGFDPSTTPLPPDPRWDVATALEDAGMHDESTAVYMSIVNDAAGDLPQLYRIARRFDDEDRVSLQARAGVFLLRAMGEGARDAIPDVYRIAYPAAYPALVEAAASEQDISPLLLLALVRQESFFDARAGSHAGALGLTQVIEPTGRAIAADLGVDPFELADLYRPKLSLRFGASYLADQLEAFDGDIYHALAAYNGGPGTAANAIESAGDDIDLFVEDLEFDETKLYVRLVTENYARYRQLYGGIAAPSLVE